MARKSEPITERTIWKLIVSGLKESSLVGLRLKDGYCPYSGETLMIRANEGDIFWIHISQLDDESAEEEIVDWDDSPDL